MPTAAFEQLESRVLLATITWDGGPDGLGTNFHDAANWVGDVLPGATDDAVISVPADPVISVTSSTTVNSISSDEAISQTAGTLTLNAASVFNALYTLSSGTLTGAGDFTFGAGLTWSGGTLGGSGLAVVPAGRVLNRIGGVSLERSLDNFGSFNNTAASTLALNQNAVLTNRPGGVFNHDGPSVIYGFGPWAYFVNEGVYNKSTGGTSGFQHQLSMTNAASGVMNIAAGTWEWSNADQFGTQFTNQGQISVAPGASVRFIRGANHADGSTITGSGAVEFNYGPHVISALVQLGPSLVMSFTGGDVTLNQSRAFAHAVTLSGGALLGSGDFTFGAGLNWSGGTLGGTGLAVIPAGQLLNSTASNTLSRSLDNFGTIDSSGGLAIYNGSVLTNKPVAIFNAGANSNIHGATNSSYSQFVNEGVYNKNGSGAFGFTGQIVLTNTASGVMNINAGTFEWSNADQFGIEFFNFGQIDIDAGTLFRFTRGGGHNPGSSITGAGTVEFNYGPHLIPDSVLLSIVMTFTGADVTLNQSRTFTHPVTLSGGSLTGSGNFTFAAGLNWSGGTHLGTGLSIIPAGQMLVGTASLTLNRSLENFGTVTLAAGSFSLALGAGAVFTNKPGAVFNHNSTGNIHGSGDSPVKYFINQGTYNKNASGSYGHSGQLIWENATTGVMNVNSGTLECTSDWSFTNNGVIDLDGGTTLRFNRGTSHGPGSSIVGAGAVWFNGGTHSIDGASLWSVAMTFPTGTITGTGDLTLSNVITWSGGLMAGSGVTIIAPGATLWLIDSNRTLSRPMHNFGTINWTNGDFILNPGAVFVNKPSGVFSVNLGVDSSINAAGGAGGASFVNEGTFNQQGPRALSLVSSGSNLLTFSHTGTFTVQGNSLSLDNIAATLSSPIGVGSGVSLNLNGSFTYNSGFDLTGPGIKRFANSATHTFVGNVTLTGTNIELLTGNVTGPGDLTITGSAFWQDATMSGTGRTTIAAGATLTLINSNRTLARALDNFGTITWLSGHLRLNPGAAFTNKSSGVFTHSSDSDNNIDATGGAGGASFVNEGIFNQQGPRVLSLVSSGGNLLTFNNVGLVDISASSLIISNIILLQLSSSTLTGGTWDVGGMLTFPAGTTITTIGAGASVRLSGPAAAINKSGGGSALATLAVNNGELTLHDGAPWGFKPAGDVFTNNGTFNVTGAGSVTVPAHVTFNNGADGVLGGTLNIGDAMRGPGPSIEFGPFDGGGVININGVVAFNQDFEIFATVNLFTPGTLTGTGNILITGTFNWFGGLQTGTGSTSVGSGNTLNMFGEGVMTLSREMTNLVAGSWTGGCLLLDGGQFSNAMGGSFTIGGTVEVLSTGAGGESFSNEGDMVLEPGSDATFGTDLAVSNSGTLVIESVVSFEEDETLFGTIELAPGGEITGPGDITFADGFVWTGGSMTGTGTTTIAATAALLMGNDNMTLSRIIENFSVAGSWTGGCLLMAGGIFNNNIGASLDIFAEPRIDVLGISGTNEFNNHGLITVHTGEFVIGVPGVNTGTIIVIPPDTLIFLAPWTYMPGSSLEGPGGVIFGGGMHSFPTGTFSITGPVGLNTGASLVLPASSLPNYNAGTFTFTGGNWTVGDGAQLFLNGADIRTIGLDTSFTIVGNGQLAALANLSRIDGALHLEDGATLAINPNSVGDALVNAGLIRIGPGSLLNISGGYQQLSAASLSIGIAGTTNALMGRLVATSSAALNGAITLAYENGFAATRGQDFRVISSTGTTGAFTTTNSPAAPAPDLKAPVLTDALGVRLVVTHIADWNNDLAVNVPDIFSFLTSWFNGQGDFDGQNGNQVNDIFAFLTAWFAA